LLIEGERIVGITDKDIPAHAQRIDVSGRLHHPGLMDANVHLFVCITPTELIRHDGQYEALIEEAAQVT